MATRSMIDEMHDEIKQWREKHPIQNWIDGVVFKDKGIADYRASYALLHPWLIIGHIIRKIKYAYQRVFRGWDDTVIWSLDIYLGEMIPIWLQAIRDTKSGVPAFMYSEEELNNSDGDRAFAKHQKEYFDILDDVIAGFKLDNETFGEKIEFTPDEKQKIHRAFELFEEYYHTFWT